MIGFKRTANVFLLVTGLALGNTAQADTLYNIMDLGILPGYDVSYGNGINAAGQVTGYVYNNGNNQAHAFVTNLSGTMIDLGTLTGGNNSYGNGINAAGQVTGFVKYGDAGQGGMPFAAFVTNNLNQMIDLTPFATVSVGQAINASGQVSGQVNGHASVTNNLGQIINLNPFSIYGSTGNGINDSGQVTGTAYVQHLNEHAFVTNLSGQMTDLGTLPGDNSSYGNAINASGLVAGYSTISNGGGYAHAFVTNSIGTMTDLGILPGYNSSHGNGINAAGQVVGDVNGDINNGNFIKHAQIAFVTNNGVMEDLNTMMVSTVTGWILNSATGINDAGQITGTGTYNGLTRAFLLTPVSSVPVPAAIWLFASGLGLLSLNRRNNKIPA